MIQKNPKISLPDHSEAKVRLLGEYLKRYLNVIANSGFTSRIKIYDLFCGEGLYADGGEGSPIVILKQLRQIHPNIKNLPQIDCHFNDIRPEKVEKAKKAIEDRNLYDPKNWKASLFVKRL